MGGASTYSRTISRLSGRQGWPNLSLPFAVPAPTAPMSLPAPPAVDQPPRFLRRRRVRPTSHPTPTSAAAIADGPAGATTHPQPPLPDPLAPPVPLAPPIPLAPPAPPPPVTPPPGGGVPGGTLVSSVTVHPSAAAAT